METTLQNRLIEAMADADMTVADLARKVGMTYQGVRALTSGRAKSMKGENLDAVSRALRVSPHWLATGKGPKEAPPSFSNPIGVTETLRRIAITFDLVTTPKADVSAPLNGCLLETTNNQKPRHILMPSKDFGVYAVAIDGDGLSPRARHGECLMIEPNSAYAAGDDIFVQHPDGSASAYQFLYRRDDRHYVLPLTGSGAPFALDPEQIKAIHLIAAIVRKTT